MSLRRKIVTAGAVVLAGLGAVLLGKPPDVPPTDVAYYEAPDAVSIDVDGGIAWSRLALIKDGGHGRAKVAGPGCVRRPVGVAAAQCRRNAPGAGLQDMSDLDRFPAAEAVGALCEAVACSIAAGEPAAETDQAKFTRLQALLADGGDLP